MKLEIAWGTCYFSPLCPAWCYSCTFKRLDKREAVYKGINKDYLDEAKPSKIKMDCLQARAYECKLLINLLIICFIT